MLNEGLLSSSHGSWDHQQRHDDAAFSSVPPALLLVHALGVFAAQDVCAVQYGQQLFRWPHLPGITAGRPHGETTEVTAIVTALSLGSARSGATMLLLLHVEQAWWCCVCLVSPGEHLVLGFAYHAP
jgi:hypothetical protein